ncbi:hypothetical protein BH09BAC2_BH09BAC2_22240 [soil metagenome]
MNVNKLTRGSIKIYFDPLYESINAMKGLINFHAVPENLMIWFMLLRIIFLKKHPSVSL